MLTFHKDTPEKVKRAIERAKETGARVRVWYGNPSDGTAWPEENDVCGYIGSSTGIVKIPLMVHNKRSMGGPGLLDHCIIRLDTTDGKTLYKHENFHAGKWEVLLDRKATDGYSTVVTHNGTTHARFKSSEKAVKYVAFMVGERYRM